MKEKLQHCFDRGVPLVGITTADPAEVMVAALSLLGPSDERLPVVTHTAGCGLSALNEEGEAALATAFGGGGSSDIYGGGGEMDLDQLTQPAEALKEARRLPAGSIIVMVHAHRWLNDMYASSALWACRDIFKGSNRMVILTGTVIELPTELQSDVILIDSPLPTAEEAKKIVERVYQDAKNDCPELPTLPGVVLKNATDAMTGLSRFSAEQTTAYAIGRDGIDLDALWQQKIKTIEQSRGLQIWTKPVPMEDVGGCRKIKEFLSKLIPAYDAGGVVWIDEIEKAMAGLSSDSTGVTQDQLNIILQYMNDNDISGIIAVGPPGASKSLMAKAAGSKTNLTIAADLGGAKSRYVGDSEANIRQNMKVIHSVTNGKPFFIATCNSIKSIPPELKRRFTAGIWFFDLPDEEEREAIWKIHLSKYGHGEVDEPTLKSYVEASNDWTGAEIETACRVASLTGETILEAMKEVLPVAISDPENLKALRSLAHGRFKSASYDGTYQMKTTAKKSAAKRKVKVGFGNGDDERVN